ncbi:MAG: hypothetical protein K2K13_06710 [Clostridiales bacterium]|nr:hypothetical protein [Clostridiales bacterium]
MKRSTKLLITATVVASLVGVGSVSYAIWSAGETKEQEVSGTTGSIRTIGNMTVTPSDASGSVSEAGAITMNALYPVDQGGSYLNYWEFTLSADVTDGTPVFKLAGELSAGSSGTPVTNAKLYWAATTPSSTTGAVPTNELKKDTAAELKNLTDNKVYVYMIATGTDAMKAKITLTFSAE